MSKFKKTGPRFSRNKILKSAGTPRKWFNVKNESETPEVYIFDQIGQDWWGDGISPEDFINDVRDIKADHFNLHINSPGGFMYEGYAIYNFLNRLDKHITAYIDGIAASMASVIPMAADKIIMPENAEFMIHDPWTMMIGTADDFRKEADQMDSLKESVLGIYESRTGMDRKELSRLMEKETYIKGAEALEMGFADEVEAPKQIAACAFDTLFSDNGKEFDNKNVVNKKRNLESSLREAGWSKSEAVAIANRSESVSVGINDKKDTKPITIIMR